MLRLRRLLFIYLFMFILFFLQKKKCYCNCLTMPNVSQSLPLMVLHIDGKKIRIKACELKIGIHIVNREYNVFAIVAPKHEKSYPSEYAMAAFIISTGNRLLYGDLLIHIVRFILILHCSLSYEQQSVLAYFCSDLSFYCQVYSTAGYMCLYL